MSCPVFHTLKGTINGFNYVFETPRSYVDGTVRVFRNGIVISAAGPDGWIERGGKRIDMKEPPVPGDVMQAYYIPR